MNAPANAPAVNTEDPIEVQRRADQKTILQTLAELGGRQITTDTGVRFHDESYVLFPKMYESQPDAAVELVSTWAKSEKKQHDFQRIFKFRPWDGAAALQRALMRVWGTAGIGVTQYSMFGVHPPQMVSVETGIGTSVQVPWGEIQFPPLEGTMELGAEYDPEYGLLFELTITCPKKYRAAVEGLWAVIENELDERSIYRGKAITGAQQPGFIDVHAVPRSSVVYSDEVEHTLQTEVWNRIEQSELFRQDGGSLKRSVLLTGPYGTGKTLTGLITGQVCVANKWTFLQVRPGEDNLQEVLKTALLYQPALVFAEDIEISTDAKGSTATQVSQVLEMFDGVRTKNTEVIVMMTTNHKNKIHKGMLRTGRLDTLIPIGSLDKNGLERLIRAVVRPEQLTDGIDYDAVYEACKDYEPAFMRGVVDGARTDALGKARSREYRLETSDFVYAARRLHPQWELMTGANEHQAPPALDTILGDLVEEKVGEFKLGPSHRFVLADDNR